MQTTSLVKRNQQGNVLVVTLFILSLMSFFLYAYLYTAREQRSALARSQGWNTALGLAEAGVEEALGQVNPGAPLPVIDRTANGWGAAVGGYYGPISRALSNGTYSVLLSDDTFPIIYATGYVAVPSIPANLTRVVRVTTTNVALFTTVLTAKYNINFTGNGIATDSFNSSNPAQSDNGRYPIGFNPSRASTNGDVASVMGLVNVGNGNINGALYLGPTASDTIGGNGTVTGGISNDFNVELEDVVLPSTSWLSPTTTNVIIGTNTFQYLFGPGTSNSGGDYTIADLKNSSIYVSNAIVRLKLTGNANPTLIQVAGAGATAGSLTIYMDGPSFTLSGQSTVDGGLAANLSYYGTTNNTSITFGGNANFTGTIYAPQADFKMGGGGSSIYDFVGSAVLKSAVINGHYNFHYDEALATTGPKRGFVPNSWTEL